jgi:uncharacterized damage-inducible protein DinB
MDHPEKHLSTFQREFLRELEIPRQQLLALAEAIPAEAYGWRPAADARSFSAVLVHIAAGNLMLLYRADVCLPEVMELCGSIEGDGPAQWLELIHKMVALEKAVTAKAAVIDLLRHSFSAVGSSFAAATDRELEETRSFFAEETTLRRLYLRMLAHSHEHMGQAIAYVRAMGFAVPWPNPIKMMEDMVAAAPGN